jgi:hypothetical protein
MPRVCGRCADQAPRKGHDGPQLANRSSGIVTSLEARGAEAAAAGRPPIICRRTFSALTVIIRRPREALARAFTLKRVPWKFFRPDMAVAAVPRVFIVAVCIACLN